MPETDVLREAELRRLDAERLKLELECKEIARRLEARWWSGGKFPQYAVAILVTSAVLFGWAKAYVLPILRRDAELNQYAVQVSSARNEVLKADQERLNAQKVALEESRDQLKNQRDQLSGRAKRLLDETTVLRREQQVLSTTNASLDAERTDLRSQKQSLERRREELKREVDDLTRDKQTLERARRELTSVVLGLKTAIDRLPDNGRSYFSILNADDPINVLRTAHQWNIHSDNKVSWLGYYLVISHNQVLSGKPILVGRSFEIEDLRRTSPADWYSQVEHAVKDSPILALDYTYVGLLADSNAPVGGTLYWRDGKIVEFHAPLSAWDQRLAEILKE